MARRGHIEGIDRETDHIAERLIGPLRGIRTDKSDREATREEEMMKGHLGGGGSEVTPQTHTNGERTHEIETTTIEDEGFFE